MTLHTADIKDHPPVPVDNFPEYHARLAANDAEDLEDEYSVRGGKERV